MNLTVPEIIILQSGAIVLGFVIHHFFISKRRPEEPSPSDIQQKLTAEVDWKLKYSGEVEMKDREIAKLKERLKDSEENLKIYEIEIEERSKEIKKYKGKTAPISDTELSMIQRELSEAREENNILQIEVEERIKEVKKLKAQLESGSKISPPDNSEEIARLKRQLTGTKEENDIFQIEINELRKQVKELKAELEQKAKATPVQTNTSGQPGHGYYEQLQQAQQTLRQENERISRLLEQINIIKEKEDKEKEMQDENAALNTELGNLKQLLKEKEDEMSSIQQKATLTREMTSMLDNAYSEFNVLQEKMHRLEVQVTASRMMSMEFDDLKEAHVRLTRDYEEQKIKLNAAVNDKQQYFRELTESDEKLKEANFQRQQLQKKVTYLEELARDLQTMAEANKKLEGQIRRIGELESMLNMVAEERDELKKQINKPT